jgi:predicted membrane protein
MIVNLFATIPFDQIDVNRGSFVERTGIAFGYARTSPTLALQLHWLNACLLILASIALIILGVKAHKKVVWILSLALGLILTVATVSGAAFIAYAGSNYYSFSMATAFIIAAILAVFLLFAIFSHQKKNTPREKEPQEPVVERSSTEVANR